MDIAFSFDTTGSMYPCLTQVRRKVAETVQELFEDIPGLRVAIMAHGDYCDGKDVLTMLDFTDNVKKICKFVESVDSTYGGDEDEAYEFVLNRARSLDWASDNKALVMIGDCSPHEVGYRYRKITINFDWRYEARKLVEDNVMIYPIQCLNRKHNNKFYDGLADISDKPKLKLEQFSEINDLLMALCYARANQLPQFEKTIEKRGNVSYNVLRALDLLAGRKARKKKTTALSKHAVDNARFQVLEVGKDCDIKGFVQRNGLPFKKGRGFYEFTKRVLVQEYKEVIAQDKNTGDMFSGDKAREVLGIPVGERAKVSPDKHGRYRGFVQSTSVNRKLLKGTNFLYEVDFSR
jgi:hypothetical protein